MSNRIGRAEFAWQKRSRDGPGRPCYAVRLKSGLRPGFYPLPETGGGLPAVYREIATPELTLPCSPATEDTHTCADLPWSQIRVTLVKAVLSTLDPSSRQYLKQRT